MSHPENPNNQTMHLTPPSALLEGWVDRYGEPLYRFALGLTHHPQVAEEIVQDVFIQAWRAHQRRPAQLLSAGWFYQVARNRCRDYHRELLRTQAIQERIEGEYRSSSTQDEERLVTTMVVHRALRRLSRTDQWCLWLFYFGGWSIPDIAAEMGSSHDAVKTRLARARRRFHQIWKEDDEG